MISCISGPVNSATFFVQQIKYNHDDQYYRHREECYYLKYIKPLEEEDQKGGGGADSKDSTSSDSSSRESSVKESSATAATRESPAEETAAGEWGIVIGEGIGANNANRGNGSGDGVATIPLLVQLLQHVYDSVAGGHSCHVTVNNWLSFSVRLLARRRTNDEASDLALCIQRQYEWDEDVFGSM